MKTKKIVSIMLAFVMLAALSISASAVTVYNKSDLMPEAEVATETFAKYAEDENFGVEFLASDVQDEVQDFIGDWKIVNLWNDTPLSKGSVKATIATSSIDSKTPVLHFVSRSAGDPADLAGKNSVIAYMSDSLANLSNNYKITFDYQFQNSNANLYFRFNIDKTDRKNFYGIYVPKATGTAQPAWILYQVVNGSRTELMRSDVDISTGVGYVKNNAKFTITVNDGAITVNDYCPSTTTSKVLNETKSVTLSSPLSVDAKDTYCGFSMLQSGYVEVSSLKLENIPELQTQITSAADAFSYEESQYVTGPTKAEIQALETAVDGNDELLYPTYPFIPVGEDNNWYTYYKGTGNTNNNTLARIASGGVLEMGKGPSTSVQAVLSPGGPLNQWTLYRPNIAAVTDKYSDWGITGWADEDWTLSFDAVLTSRISKIGVLLGFNEANDTNYSGSVFVEIDGNYRNGAVAKILKKIDGTGVVLATNDTVIPGTANVNNLKVAISKVGNNLTVSVYNATTDTQYPSASYTGDNLFSNDKGTFGFTQMANASSNLANRSAQIDNVKFVKNAEFIKDGTSDLKEDFAYANTEYLYDVDTQPTAGVYEKIDAEGNWYTDYTKVNGGGNVRAKISGGALAMTGGPARSIDTGFNRGWTLYRPDCDVVLDTFGEWGLEGWSGDYKLSFDGKLNKATTRFSAVFDYASGNDDYYMVQVNGGYSNSPCFALYKHTAGSEATDTLDIDDYTFNNVFSDISKITFHIDITRKDNTITAELYNANNGDKITTLSYTDEAAPQHTVATFGFTETALAGSDQAQFNLREAYIDNVSFVAYDEEADSSIMLNYGYKNIGENSSVLFGEYEDGVLKRILVGGGNGTSVTFNGYNPFRTYKAFFWNEFMPLQSPDTIN
ncbi:MAG: hypothetical protein E7389_00685 [Ruminococcaceae bacterium]|jgi:hypothetical protein|nr:hypothetical protein [Oscillospiraceae bacterium]